MDVYSTHDISRNVEYMGNNKEFNLKKGFMAQAGFTLIELLVVIAILGILAAVAIPNFQNMINKGRTEAIKTELSIVQTAVVAYMAETNAGTITAGVITPAAPGVIAPYLSSTLKGSYSYDTSGKVNQTETGY
jgi:prepilin-type N-terminal cleavage/methylation domain-containing protein